MRSFILKFLAYLTWTFILLAGAGFVGACIYGLYCWNIYSKTLPHPYLADIALFAGMFLIVWLIERIGDIIADYRAEKAARKEFGDHLFPYQ
jgi:uncharacterized membrane protein